MNPTAIAILSQHLVGAAVIAAVEQLLLNDALLLEIDANERSIAYRLAMYLQVQIPGMQVDCEYNRDGIDPKKIQHLELYPDDEDTEARTAYPDIIVHKRLSKDNLLVIELKKSSNKEDRKTDFAKLRGYKKNLGFSYALFLELETDGVADVLKAEWV